MVYNSWGASPLYENELLQKGSIPTVILGSKVLGEGNCGSGDRPWEGSLRMRSLSRHPLRRRPHSRQNCEATNRNLIQGRIGQESATLHWRSEGPNHEEQGGATDELGSRCRAVDVRLPQWRYPRTKVRHLVQLGVDLQMAIKHAISRKRYGSRRWYHLRSFCSSGTPVTGESIAIGTVSLVKIAVSIHAVRNRSPTDIFCSLPWRVAAQPGTRNTINEIIKTILRALVPIEA
jgi:5-methylcytosine-specific restriction endonuclease McrA